MKVSRIIVGMIVCALSSQLAWSQEASQAGAAEALGYFDFSTGSFRPVRQMADFDSDILTAAATQGGSFVVNFTITIRSAIPTNSVINCGVSAVLTEASVAGVNIITEGANVAATRTGNTAKCTVTIPYSWQVLNPATARVSLSYILSASRATAATGLLNRTSGGSIASIPVPANGATTPQTVNAVL